MLHYSLYITHSDSKKNWDCAALSHKAFTVEFCVSKTHLKKESWSNSEKQIAANIYTPLHPYDCQGN